MSKSAEKTDPKLWEKVKHEVTEGDKGGRPGQWSARKAQMATKLYQERGGDYKGEKAEDNSLTQWTKQEWDTKSGERSQDTGERYLPKKARDHLKDSEYRATSEKKRQDTKAGKQFSKQPTSIAKKTRAKKEPA